MANYPNSVYSPSAKSAGQTIAAGFFNDPDGEITAIEDGILNGTARLNSSNSTVATLSVTGASTFGARPSMPPPQFALVFLETTKTLGSSAASTMVWNAQGILINSSMHSTTTNPERLTPQSTGVYRMTAQIGFTVNSSGFRAIALRDSTGDVVSFIAGVPNAGAQPQPMQITGYKRFDALGGWVTCDMVIDGPSTLSLSTGVGITWFAMEKL